MKHQKHLGEKGNVWTQSHFAWMEFDGESGYKAHNSLALYAKLV